MLDGHTAIADKFSGKIEAMPVSPPLSVVVISIAYTSLSYTGARESEAK